MVSESESATARDVDTRPLPLHVAGDYLSDLTGGEVLGNRT